jgi:hypothetical protein
MNPQQILLLLQLTSIGLDILTEIQNLIKRVQAGDEITDAELEAAGKRVNESVANWNLAATKPETTEQPEPK